MQFAIQIYFARLKLQHFL